MKVNRYLSLFGISFFSLFYACTEEKKPENENQAPPVVITNNDIEQARELFLTDPVIDSTWLIDSSNTGFGQRQDFNSDSALVKHMYAQEENTDWYKFVGSADTSLSITVEPNDPAAEYDMVVFKSTGDSVGPDLRKGLIPAIRSNFAKISKPEDTITGLQCDPRLADYVPVDSTHQFSRAFWMQKGETYFVVLNTNTPKGKGYKLRIHSCAPGEYGKPVPPSPPVIASFKPTSAGAGRPITIYGKHFSGATFVFLGGTTVSSFEVVSDNEIKAVVADGATGMVVVSTPNGSAEKDGFRYYVPGKGGKKRPVARKKPQQEDDGDYYIVKPKDTMFSIAFIFGMTVDEILKLNNLNNTNVFVGQKLKVIRRQLPQKVIEQKVSKAPVVKSSTPEKGSTTDPVEVAKPKPADPVAPIANEKPKDWNITPNYPENQPKKTNLEEKGTLEPADKSFYLYCNVTSGVNKQPVGGTLQVVDLKEKTLVYNVQANKTAKVPLFNKGGRQKMIICDIFGYKKQDFDINLDNLINDTTENYVQVVDDTIVVNFELKRLEKGDVAVAYNIFYYDDASVMLPKSTYELDQLLEMLNENPKYKVRIHGHTNTSKLGKILYLEKGDQNFFRLTAKNKETFGPAKMLSKKRAETIKYYLVSKRITDDRIETEGHGGSDMLYPATHPLAFKNKRVEIEILEDK
jgi:outer membrane protein OmpA-like peptidoglycan-associated protein